MNREMRKDLSQDKKTVAQGVHKHEKKMHKGEPLTPMKKGGRACMFGGGVAKPATPAVPNVGRAGAPAPSMPMRRKATQPASQAAPKKTLMNDAKKPMKFAAGGVAKIRHNQATSAGAPKAAPRKFKGTLI
jgi:hypothetical protein